MKEIKQANGIEDKKTSLRSKHLSRDLTKPREVLGQCSRFSKQHVLVQTRTRASSGGAMARSQL